MRLIRGRIAAGAMPGGAVVTIGKFDGLHRGHRALLAKTVEEARARSLPAVMLSFEPLPEEFFLGNRARARLNRFATKWRLVEAYGGMDALACLQFDAALAAQPPEDFVRETLVEDLNATVVVVGQAFRFGHDRAGDVALLERMGHCHGFEVMPIGPVCDRGGRISSSRVHDALVDNRLDEAGKFLGRPYRLYGRVRAGDKLGVRLGFPTANLALGRRPPPLAGIYVVRAEGLPGGARYGMASVGERPTVAGGRRLLEIYFPGFDGDLYGCLLAVDFLHWVRAEDRFESLDALKAAIAADVEAGGRWLAAHGRDWKDHES
ncbi:MAG: bifunctional riboflavin kinase/FAD synthetase [Gammaproteobacteria bacterium]